MTRSVDNDAIAGSTITALEQILDERWTCRAFRPDPVSRSAIERMLRVAQRTPSWCNTQPWQVVVTDGAGTETFRRALLAHIDSGGAMTTDLPFPAEYDGDYRARRRECGAALYESLGITREDKLGALLQMRRNFELFDAPHVAIITTPAALGVYGAVDCGLYIGNFLNAAAALGLGAAPQAALAGYSDFIHAHFGIPDDRQIVAGISFGHPETDHPVNGFRTSRAALDDAVTFRTD